MSADKKDKELNPTPLSQYATPSIDLLSVMRPPKGFRMERVLCFSYSLDASVAIALLCSAFGVEERDLHSTSVLTGLNKIDQIRFLKSVLHKSLFVIQHSEDPIRGIGGVRNDVSAGLQDRVFAIQRPRDHFAEHSSDWINFHPKIIFVEFRRKDSYWLRVHLGSKNLSLGAAMEGGITVELPPSKLSYGTPLSDLAFTQPLAAFIKAAKDEGLLYSKQRGRDILRQVQELDYWTEKLRLSKGRRLYGNGLIEDISVVSQFPGSNGISEALSKDLQKSSKTVIVSPWCDSDTTRWLLKFKPRGENLAFWVLDSERRNLLPLKGEAHRIETHAVSSIYDSDTEGEVIAQDRDLRHHAKIFAIDRQNGSGILWAGSANWTRPGIGLGFAGRENFEIMARLEVKGKASKLLGELDTVPIDDTDATADTKEKPLTKQERLRRLLHWFQLSWARYPNELTIRLLVPPPREGYADLKFKSVFIEVRRTFESDEYEVYQEIPWRTLLKGDSLTIEPRKPFPREVILDSTLRLSTNLGIHAGLVHCLVPVPDKVAQLRSDELRARAIPGIADMLERLISIQDGFKRRFVKPPLGNNDGSGGGIDSYLRTLRLEKVFLQLTTDPDVFEENIDDVRNIQELLDAEIKKNPTRAELLELSESLKVITAEALAINGKRKANRAA